jgi:hypothetical protein
MNAAAKVLALTLCTVPLMIGALTESLQVAGVLLSSLMIVGLHRIPRSSAGV